MMKSIDSANKRKKGRPPVDTAAVNLRLATGLIAVLDDFRRKQADMPTRQEAIRRILVERLTQN